MLEVKKTGTFFKGTCYKARAGANQCPGKSIQKSKSKMLKVLLVRGVLQKLTV